MEKRVRLVDIAERLNITKVSVSKALRNHPDISRETRELVKKVAAEMGYSPNLVARSLSSRRSHTLGVVVPKIVHTFFAAIIDAIQEEATQQGYGIVLAVSNEDAALEAQHIERLLAMRVDGLLVSVSKETPELDVYRQVQGMKVPLVFFDRPLRGLGFSSVTVDDRRGAVQAVEFLLGEGCTQIAHIAGVPEVEIGRERLEGYREALARHGIPVRDHWVIEGGFDEWHGHDAFLRILESGDIPDAVFAVTFPVGLGVWGALREHAPHLQDRVRIVAFGEGGLNEFYTYPHVCVRQPTREMGRRAVQLLLDEVERGFSGEPREVVLQTELVGPSAHRPAPLGAAGESTAAG